MDRFECVKELGSGTYGTAVLVKEKETNHYYVVKIVPFKKQTSQFKEDTRKEVRILSSLKHRNIIRCYESFEENGALHIVTEYCNDGDLEKKCKTGYRMDEKQVWDYFVQICIALQYIHKRKVLHRDLKPGNIFLTKRGEVKLGDFGLSKALKHTLDMATTFAGTPYYLPPEMCTQQEYNDKCDMWSLGVILYEMVMGNLPFMGGNLLEIATTITLQPHAPLSTSISKELREIITALLQKDPRNRPTAADILQRSLVRTVARRFCSEEELREEAQSRKPLDLSALRDSAAVELLEEIHKLKFNEQGRLVDSTGDGYSFHFHGDKVKDQERYEQVGELARDAVYSLVGARLEKIYLHKDKRGTFVYASKGYTTSEKLLVLIHGSGVVRAGQWSRRLTINDSLKSGTQLPYIDRAMRNGWAVLVLNPNDTHQLEGCKSATEHARYVWVNFIHCYPTIKKIGIIAHSAGGSVVTSLLQAFEDDFKRRVFAIAFTDAHASAHKSARNYFHCVTRNWVMSAEPLGVEVGAPGSGVARLSAGTTEHEETSHAAFEDVFDFLNLRFRQDSPAQG